MIDKEETPGGKHTEYTKTAIPYRDAVVARTTPLLTQVVVAAIIMPKWTQRQQQTTTCTSCSIVCTVGGGYPLQTTKGG